MHSVWIAHCPACDISWQSYGAENFNCPRCGGKMDDIARMTVPEKLDLGPGWHRIVVLPDEPETAGDVVEREVQRWRDGDESDMPDEDSGPADTIRIIGFRKYETGANEAFRSDLINAGDNWKAQQERVVQAYETELTRWQKEYFKHSAIPLLKPQSASQSRLMTLCRWVMSIWHWIRGK